MNYFEDRVYIFILLILRVLRNCVIEVKCCLCKTDWTLLNFLGDAKFEVGELLLQSFSLLLFLADCLFHLCFFFKVL